MIAKAQKQTKQKKKSLRWSFKILIQKFKQYYLV